MFGEPSSDRQELLFLANSADLVDLLVKFNMAQHFPQLASSRYVFELQSKQQLLHADTINQWQTQRMTRVARIMAEYKETGWFMVDSLEALKEPFEQANELANYSGEYREAKITARDIILPPFPLDNEEMSGTFIVAKEAIQLAKQASPNIEEELPLEGIPFVGQEVASPKLETSPMYRDIKPWTPFDPQ